MNLWQIMNQAAGDRGNKQKLADIYEVSDGLYRKWCREPESSDNPSGTGQASPLDRIIREIDKLLDAHLLVNPVGAEIIAEAVSTHMNDHLHERHLVNDPTWTPTKSRMDLVDKVGDLLKAISEDSTGVLAEQEGQELLAVIRERKARLAKQRQDSREVN